MSEKDFMSPHLGDDKVLGLLEFRKLWESYDANTDSTVKKYSLGLDDLQGVLTVLLAILCFMCVKVRWMLSSTCSGWRPANKPTSWPQMRDHTRLCCMERIWATFQFCVGLVSCLSPHMVSLSRYNDSFCCNSHLAQIEVRCKNPQICSMLAACIRWQINKSLFFVTSHQSAHRGFGQINAL